MKLGVVKESCPGEQRIALVPGSLAALAKAGFQVIIESGAGEGAFYPDAEYQRGGAQIASSRGEVFAAADVVVQVRALGANPRAGIMDLGLVRPGQIVVGLADPLGSPAAAQQLAARGGVLFAMELIPRITRAQTMDALSSMATVAGYKAVLLAAAELPKMFPLMMTAAGTISPARVFVVGAGVAGLQAIASARRMGAVVQAYDVRPAVKEQVQSLGARFLDLPLETGQAEGQGGYARQLDEAFYRRQREMMLAAMGSNDVVITTALVPGKPAPKLVTAEMVRAMAPGSMVIDLAAERGGNCELTRPDERVVHQGVTILGPTNLPATVPHHASQLYAKNISTLLVHLAKEGKFQFDLDDEITRETLVAYDGRIVHPAVRAALETSAT